MSGDKYTRIEYDRRGETILEIRALKDDLKKTIEKLYEQIAGTSGSSEKLKKTLNENVLKKVNEQFIEILLQNKQKLQSTEKELQGTNDYAGATQGRLDKMHDRLKRERRTLSQVAGQVAAIETKIVVMEDCDSILSELNSAFDQLESMLKTNQKMLMEWQPEQYAAVLKEIETIKKGVEQYTARLPEKAPEKIDSKPLKRHFSNLQRQLQAAEQMVFDYGIKDKELRAVQGKAGELKQYINKILETAADRDIAAALKNNLALLNSYQIRLQSREYEGLEKKIDLIRQSVSELLSLDSLFTALQQEIAGLANIEDEAGVVLQRWSSAKYRDWMAEKAEVVSALVTYRQVLARGTVPKEAEVKNLLDRLKKVKEGIDQAMPVVEEKEKRHRERLYVVKSLREVCDALGFKEKGEPYYEVSDDKSSAVVQAFDTLVYGNLTFRFKLDGDLESSSPEMNTEHCGDKFSDITDLLVNKYGINTDFRIRGEDKPLRRTKTEKDLPDSSPAESKEKGGS